MEVAAQAGKDVCWTEVRHNCNIPDGKGCMEAETSEGVLSEVLHRGEATSDAAEGRMR